ncbi:MAG: cytidine deaminase [Rhodobacteraceae bacterium]|nr:cytidine deaminase [Paracoccaceae bacterium]
MTLLKAAQSAQKNAYAPYSGFRVGAAILGRSGAIFSGCNVENVAYPEGTCAEAGAIAAMINAGERRIAEVLVISDSASPVSPCGGCRQKLVEFGSTDVVVTMIGRNGARLTMTLGDLLPGAFSEEHLKGV